MKRWIEAGGRLFGGIVFFTVLIGLMIRPDIWRFPHWIIAFGCSAACGLIGWLIGIVSCDILFKGICADIGIGDVDAMVEGGLIQRIQMMNKQLIPGGTEMPFAGVAPEKIGGLQNKRKE